jgi:hypothetical protein
MGDNDWGAAGAIVERTLGKEVVQPSTIAHYTWPENDPESIDQPRRLVGPADLAAVCRAATPGTPDPATLRRNTRRMSLSETVLFILSRETFNFNGPAVNREPLWQERVAEAVRSGRPVRLVYPLICKIGCWAKQMTNIGPNAAEQACLHFFNHLNHVVKEFYAPGVVVELVCDAHLYNSAIQVPYHEVNAYVRQFTDLAREVAPETVRLHDYCDLLEQFDSGSRRYRAAYQRYNRLLRERPEDALGAADRGGLFESVRALVNTRRLGLSYDDHREIFGPAPDHSNPHWAEIEAMTLSAVREMVATRMACSELDVLGAAFGDQPSQTRAVAHVPAPWGLLHHTHQRRKGAVQFAAVPRVPGQFDAQVDVTHVNPPASGGDPLACARHGRSPADSGPRPRTADRRGLPDRIAVASAPPRGKVSGRPGRRGLSGADPRRGTPAH